MVEPVPFPVSGAWVPGDEPGHRRFVTIASDRPAVKTVARPSRGVEV